MIAVVGGLVYLGGSSGPSVGGPTPSATPSPTIDEAADPDPAWYRMSLGHWVAEQHQTACRSGRDELILELRIASASTVGPRAVTADAWTPPASLTGIHFGADLASRTQARSHGPRRRRLQLRYAGLDAISDVQRLRRSLIEGRRTGWPPSAPTSSTYVEWLEVGRHSLTVDGLRYRRACPRSAGSGLGQVPQPVHQQRHLCIPECGAVVDCTAFPDGDQADPRGVLSRRRTVRAPISPPAWRQ